MDATPITSAWHNRLFVDSTPCPPKGQASTGDATGYACNGALGYCRAADRFASAEPMLRACEILSELQSKRDAPPSVSRGCSRIKSPSRTYSEGRTAQDRLNSIRCPIRTMRIGDYFDAVFSAQRRSGCGFNPPSGGAPCTSGASRVFRSVARVPHGTKPLAPILCQPLPHCQEFSSGLVVHFSVTSISCCKNFRKRRPEQEKRMSSRCSAFVHDDAIIRRKSRNGSPINPTSRCRAVLSLLNAQVALDIQEPD